MQNYDPSQDGEGFRSALMTGVVQVRDGRLTLDSIGGESTEIQWLELERIPDVTPDDGRSADLDYSFFVDPVAASLEDGQVPISIGPDGDLPTGIDPTSSLIVGINLQAPGHRGPNIAHVDGVKLVETLTGAEVAVDVQITGGADSLTIRPLQDLKENTSYTLKVEDVLDLGAVSDADAPLRRMQDLTTTFVTGEAPEVVARDVAFTEAVLLDGFVDGAGGFTSIEFGPDGRLYVATIMGEIHRWDVSLNGTIDESKETLAHDCFDQGAAGRRGIIGLTFGPEDPNTIWVTDNWPIPREGKAYSTPEFSGRVSKIALGSDGSFDGVSVETYAKGLPRSGGDHVTNSLEFRANPDASGPDHLLYVTQGSNIAAGRADVARESLAVRHVAAGRRGGWRRGWRRAGPMRARRRRCSEKAGRFRKVCLADPRCEQGGQRPDPPPRAERRQSSTAWRTTPGGAILAVEVATGEADEGQVALERLDAAAAPHRRADRHRHGKRRPRPAPRPSRAWGRASPSPSSPRRPDRSARRPRSGAPLRCEARPAEGPARQDLATRPDQGQPWPLLRLQGAGQGAGLQRVRPRRAVPVAVARLGGGRRRARPSPAPPRARRRPRPADAAPADAAPRRPPRPPTPRTPGRGRRSAPPAAIAGARRAFHGEARTRAAGSRAPRAARWTPCASRRPGAAAAINPRAARRRPPRPDLRPPRAPERTNPRPSGQPGPISA